ncbi:MAG TPA: hypothetical protein VN256_16835 [Pyrinomonadaceae bacterium]|nr:hypothetical protein [Pyrinomonadaceae bacterium]
MSAVLKFAPTKRRLTTPRERWLQELINSEREDRNREADEYARRIADLQTHARKLGQIALNLQEAQARAQVGVEVKEKAGELRQKFHRLADEWRKETKHTSSVEEMVLHPNYLKIIAMGKDAIALLLEELERKPDHWLVALHVLTDEDPASPESTFYEAVQAWLEWGKQKGYLT